MNPSVDNIAIFLVNTLKKITKKNAVSGQQTICEITSSSHNSFEQTNIKMFQKSQKVTFHFDLTRGFNFNLGTESRSRSTKFGGGGGEEMDRGTGRAGDAPTP